MHVFEAWLHLFHPRRSNNHRPRLLHAESLFMLVAIAITFVGLLTSLTKIWSGATGQVLGYATAILAEQVVNQTNAKRLALGVPALQTNSALEQAAQLKAVDMFAHQYWSHTSPQGKQPWDFIRTAGYDYQAAGENLARDFMGTSEMIDAWMNSPTHRVNIVNPRYQAIGVAVVNGTLNGTETTLVVQLFGRPRVAAQPAAVSAASIEQVTLETSPLQLLANSPVTPALTTTAQPTILSAMSLIAGSIRPWPVVSPLQLTKAFLLSILLLLMATLAYDWVVIRHRPRSRVVGENLAHLLFFANILFLLVTFHSGIIR